MTILSTIESKILKYLNCLSDNGNYILINDAEIKQIIEEINEFSCDEILNIFKNLESLDYIKIKYFNSENYLLSLTEKGKNFNENLKLKNSQICIKNAKFYSFLLTILGSFLGTVLALILYLNFN